MQSMMGVVCDANHKPLEYDHLADDYTITQGIVISKNKKVFDTAIDRLVSRTGHDLSFYHEKTLKEVAEYRR